MDGQHRYRVLMIEMCAEVGLAQPEQLYDTGRLEVDGIPITLLYDETLDADRVFIYADLDPSKTPLNSDALRQLLAWNLAVDVPRDGVFGIHPTSGYPVLRHGLYLDALKNGQALANELVQLARRAQGWAEQLAPLIAKTAADDESAAETRVVAAITARLI